MLARTFTTNREQNTVHRIETREPPPAVYEKSRRLSPEKLVITKKELVELSVSVDQKKSDHLLYNWL